MNDNRNLVLALVLSGLILAGYYYFFAPDPAQTPPPPPAAAATDAGGSTPVGSGDDPQATNQGARPDAVTAAARVAIDTPAVRGSINLAGARLDDLELKRYREELPEDSPIVRLLTPGRDQGGYFAAFAWSSADPGLRQDLPGLSGVWSAPAGAALTPETPVTLTYEAGDGLRFTRTISIDGDYMLTFVDRVENGTGRPVSLFPIGGVYRYGVPEDLENFMILHEGPIGYFDDGLEQWKYKKFDDESFSGRSTTGWLGITDKYWLAALIPAGDKPFEAAFGRVDRTGGPDVYSTRFNSDAYEIANGASISVTQRLFAGAKRVELIDAYTEEFAIARFDLAIDWGHIGF